jgi:hypothetical protein
LPRIDTDGARIKAIDIAYDRFKLLAVTQEFARDHGLTLPAGMRNMKSHF